MAKRFSRRTLMAVATAASACHASPGKLALLGGDPVRKQPFPAWPVYDQREEKALSDVLHSGKWFRGSGKVVDRFGQKYAELMGARHCLPVANGTSALFTSLNALGVGPGDEVIVPPYTFIATVNVVLLQHALPVFVDTDIETFQMDAGKLEEAVTDRSAAIIPVHLGGGTVDLDAVLRIGQERELPVIEDACQAHLAEWKGRKVGTFGATGCFSFQASKNLNSGEGGAVLTDDDAVAANAYAFHNNSRGRGGGPVHVAQGTNVRLTEFQAGLLLAQMTRLEAQSRRREENAGYLTNLLNDIPGIQVARTYSGCTRNAWHLFMFRYDKDAFAGTPRKRFLEALRAEGIPCSGGYNPLNRRPFLRNAFKSKGYRRIYPEKLLRDWEERNQCPVNDRLCTEAVWFTQTMLLGARSDMDQIAEAIRKIQRSATDLSGG